METQFIFKYTTQRNGIHFIPQYKIKQFKKDPLFKNDEIFEKLKPDAYGLSPFFIINPKKISTYYTPLLKKKITRRIYKDDDEKIVE